MTLRRTDLRRRLDAAAFRQAGYFSAAQALEIGYTYQAQKYHVDTGNWIRVDRGLFRLPAWPTAADDEQVRWALWSGGRAVVSHESALRVHGLSDVDPARVHLSVPPGFRATDPSVALHRHEVPSGEIEQRAGWRVTAPARTLIDAAASALSQEHVDVAVEQAIERGLVTRRALRAGAADATSRARYRLELALTRLEATA